jgi:plasmid stability protein
MNATVHGGAKARHGLGRRTVRVRNLSEETHRALTLRAAQRGRDIESEAREILEADVRSPQRIKLGSLLAEIGREVGGVDLRIERDKTAGQP